MEQSKIKVKSPIKAQAFSWYNAFLRKGARPCIVVGENEGRKLILVAKDAVPHHVNSLHQMPDVLVEMTVRARSVVKSLRKLKAEPQRASVVIGAELA